MFLEISKFQLQWLFLINVKNCLTLRFLLGLYFAFLGYDGLIKDDSISIELSHLFFKSSIEVILLHLLMFLRMIAKIIIFHVTNEFLKYGLFGWWVGVAAF